MSGDWLGTDVPLRAHHERPKGMGLHICAVVQRGASAASECVEVVNDGAAPVSVSGLELTDCCAEHHEHIYSFPKGELGAGETAYVYTGDGHSQRTHTGDLMLYAGLPAPVFKDDSHVAHLRHPDGRIIDTLRAGRPPRHPDGH